MKKIILIITAALLFASANLPAQTSFRLHYDFMNSVIATNAGAQYRYFVTELNDAYTSANTGTMKWAEVRFDSLVNFNYNTGTVIGTFPLSTSTIRIDSVEIAFSHVNHSGTNNVITVSIYRGGAPTSATAHTGVLVWSNSINTSTSLSPGYSTNGLPTAVFRTFFPATTLPQGQYYSVRLGFTGSVSQDTLRVISGIRDNCNSLCNGVPAYIRNSFYYYYSTIGSYLFTSTSVPLFGDCSGNSTFDANLCEDWYIQNLVIGSYVTITATTLSINPTASASNICSSQNVSLNANASGGTGPFTYSWSNGSTSSSPTVNVSSTTTYSVTVTDQGAGQTRTGSVTVNVRSISVYAGNDQTVSCPFTTALSASISGTTSGATYQWSTGSTASSTNVAPSVTTNYTVTVTNSYGCTASDVVTVICSSGGCNAPTPTGQVRFTPGYDNINCINQNQAYSQVVYFEAPFTLAGATIEWVRFDSIVNTPCGINWSTNNITYVGGEVGCITYSGTTNDFTGSYSLQFFVTVKVNILPSPIAGELNNLLTQFGITPIPYYLKVKTSATSCQPASSLISRNSCNSPQAGDYYISAGGTYSVCSGNFYDSGGQNGNYGSSENYSITFTRIVSGQQVRVSFNQFQTEPGYDYLHAYDGTTTNSPLIGTYNGSSIPSAITSTSGSLTFNFTSDGSDQYSGWRATISCISVPLTVSSFDQSICKGEGVQLQAQASGGTGNYIYTWSPSPTLSSSSVSNPVATPLSTTTYTVTVSDGSNIATATSTVTVNNPPVVNAGPDRYISDCTGSISITATTNSIIYYATWDNFESGLTNPYAHQGINTIYVVDGNNCFGSDDVNVFLTGSSQIISFTAPSAGCVNVPITFTNTSSQLSGWTWRWDFDDGATSVISNAIHSFTQAYSYDVTLRGDSGTCQLFYSSVINITPCIGSLSVTISGSTQACAGSTTVLTANVSGSGNYTYSWTPAIFSGSSNSSYAVSPASTTTFSVNVSDLSGNSNVASHTITVKPKPFVDAGADVYICPGGSAQIFVSTNDGSGYSWQPSTGLSCSNCPNPTANPSSTTTYSVGVTGSNGCTSYDDVTVYLSSTAPASVVISSAPIQPCGGDNIQLTAIVVNGGSNPTFSWKRNGSVIGISSTVSGRYDAGDILTVDIVSNLSCASPNNATYSLTIPSCVGIDESFVFGNVSIYPNPNEGSFIIDIEGYDSQGALTVQLFTIDGRQIYSEQIPAQPDIFKSMEFENLNEGLYLVRISNQNKQILKKMMINR